MAKIKNTTIYNYDSLVSLEDYVIGSDADTSNKKTKNYKIGDIASLIIKTIGIATENGIVGGSVYWIENLDFGSTSIQYFIGGTYYSAPARPLMTLSPADPTNPRVDSFVVTTDGVLIVIEGTPAPNPVAPPIDFDTQLLVTSVYIAANATVPTGVTEDIVYSENAGEPTEWDTTESTVGARIALGSTNDPDDGTISIEGTLCEDDDIITFTNLEYLITTGISSLNFRIKNKNASAFRLEINFYNDDVLISNRKINVESGFFGYDSANITDYQTINIPSTVILFEGSNINKVTFSVKGLETAGTEGFFIDKVRFVIGIDNPTLNNTYLNLIDTFDLNYIGKAGYSPVVTESENGLKLERLPKFTDIYSGNAIIRGGYIHLGGLDYYIWATAYIINNVVYFDSVNGNVTLNSADPTDSRFDVFVINNDGLGNSSVGVVEGTPDPDPTKPEIDLETQVEVGFKLLLANETDPNIITTTIYKEDEGSPNEWDAKLPIPVGMDTAYPVAPYEGAVSISFPGQSAFLESILEYNTGTPIATNNSSQIVFAIKLSKGGANLRSRLRIRIGNGLIFSQWVNMTYSTFINYNINITLVNEWQIATVPVSEMNFSANSFNTIQFGARATYQMFYDDIKHQQDTSQPGPIIPDRTSQLLNDGENGVDPFITFSDLYSGNAILYGGVVWVQNLEYYVWASSYIINNKVYKEPSDFVSGTVTLNPAHPTLSRFDLFVVKAGTSATGSVELTGGGAGSVDGITVNGIEIMGGAEIFDTDLPTTAINVAQNINSFASSPNYTATVTGNIITIIPDETGSTYNGLAVVSTTTTITTTDTNLSGGSATNSVGIVTGTPDADPQRPNLNLLYAVEAGFKLLLGAETSDPNATTVLIYDEDLGQPTEFDGLSIYTGGSFSHPTLPYQGGSCILLPADPSIFGGPDPELVLDSSTIYDYDSTGVFFFWLKTDSLWSPDVRFQFTVRDSGGSDITQYFGAGSILNYGFNHTLLGVWQQVIIPITDLIGTITQFDQLVIANIDNTSPIYIDFIQYQYGVAGGPTLGVDTFLELTDTPNEYLGQALKFVRVKATENGLEFATIVVSAPIPVTYSTLANLVAGQGAQLTNYIYEITDGSGFSGILSGRVFAKYLGTTNGNETDYTIISKEEVVPPIPLTFADTTALFAGQTTQTLNYIYEVTDGSGFVGISTGSVFVKYLGTTNANATDYKIITKDEPPIPLTYADTTALFAGQANQLTNYLYEITDGSGFPGISTGTVWAKYLGTTNGDETDYVILTNGIQPEYAEIGYAASDETTDMAVGPGQLTMRMPFSLQLTDVIISLNDGPFGSSFICDVLDDGVSIFTPTGQVVIDAQVRATGSVEITSGAGGQISGITVNAVQIMSGAVVYTTDIPTTATAVAANITAFTSSPNYTASAVGGLITITSVTSGAAVNGFVVVSTPVTLTTTDINMAGGVTSETSDISVDPLEFDGTQTLAMNSEISIDVTQKGSIQAGTGLKVWFKGIKV